MLENKLAYAREFGATDIIDASKGDSVERVQGLTDGGVDYAFEAIGFSKTIEQAYAATGLGGTTVIVGMAPENDNMTFSALDFPRTEKTLKGSWYGGARPFADLPKMVDLYMDGKLKVDEMVSRYYKLDEINTAYDALANGEVARSIISFN